MKLWIKPRVEVEGFAANEYVAACSQVVKPIDKKARYAMDFYNGTRLDYDGPADGTFNGVNDELISNGTLPGGFTSGGNDVHGKWFTNKTLYRVKKVLPSGELSYSNTTYFEPVGVYDVYVSRIGLTFWCYPEGTGGGFDPDDKPYS